MTTLTNKGFKMVNYKLAAADSMTLEQTPALGAWLLHGHGKLRQLVILFKHWDQKAQQFFDAQASTRAQESLEVQWGFDLDSGF